MKISAYIVLSMLILAGCGTKKDEFKKHKHGFQYMFIDRAQAGLSPRIGDIATMRIAVKAPNDSVIKKTNFFRVQVKKSAYKGGINQAIRFMREGDSIAFLIDALKYYRHDAKEKNVPDIIQKGDLLRFDIRLTDVQSMEEFQRERKINKISGEKREALALKKFLRSIAISDSVTMDSIYVKKEKTTDGKQPEPGDKVSIHYLGYFVDGDPFDNSYERGKPFQFRIGSKQVIEGLEKGVQKMHVGEKATIVIPSPLAYGSEGMPKANIAPFTTLIFDVELLKVE